MEVSVATQVALVQWQIIYTVYIDIKTKLKIILLYCYNTFRHKIKKGKHVQNYNKIFYPLYLHE